MAIPDYQTIMLPLLQVAADGQEHKASDAYVHLAQLFELTEEEQKLLVPSGQDYLFLNRCGWAKTYLKKAGLLVYPYRGRFQITSRGDQLLKEKPEKIDVKTLKKYPEFLEYWNGGTPNSSPEPATGSNQPEEIETPEDKLESAVLKMRNEVRSELLNKLKNVAAAAFELVVLRLIQKMGYGEAGQTLGRSHDGGIDGVVREDKLGLDRIYFQAKRWKDTVGAGEVRDFVGALAGKKAKRGVFITASKFSGDAKTYAEALSEYSVILIDGERLADLMFEFDMGTTVSKTYAIKRIDNDFFDELEEG